MKRWTTRSWGTVILLWAALLTLPGGPRTTAAPARQAARPIYLTDPVPDPQQPGVQYFPATGHTLRGAFREYWTRYGGLAQFGYPLTEEFTEPVGPDQQQLQVQYFERNRFELHPENAGSPYEVLLGTLGRAFHTPDPPVSPQAGARYFPETGHNLSGAFLAYWDAHGGLFVHGYPLTEPFQEVNSTDGKLYNVQYLERSRFEWHPENVGSPYEVLLGQFGTQLAQQQGYPYGRYPQYGHAADFSWIAGEMLWYSLPGLTSMDSGCSVLQYDGKEAAFQLNFPGEGRPYRQPGIMRKGGKFVFFGRPARPEEPAWLCIADNAPIYYVDRVQVNPVP